MDEARLNSYFDPTVKESDKKSRVPHMNIPVAQSPGKEYEDTKVCRSGHEKGLAWKWWLHYSKKKKLRRAGRTHTTESCLCL